MNMIDQLREAMIGADHRRRLEDAATSLLDLDRLSPQALRSSAAFWRKVKGDL